MEADIDFMIHVDGDDISKDVMLWTLHEVDDGTSSITVKLANPNLMSSGKYDIGGQLTLMFGNRNEMSENIQMEIRGLSEDYTMGYPTITLKAEDCTRDLEEGGVQGMADSGKKLTDVMKELTEKALGLKLQLKDAQDAEWAKQFRVPTLTGGTIGENLAWYSRMLKFE